MQRSGFQAVLSWANQRSVSKRGVSPEVSLSAVLKLASLKDQWRVKISGQLQKSSFSGAHFFGWALWNAFFFCVSFQLDVPLACSQHMQLVPFLVRNLRKPSVTPTHKRLLCGDALIPIRHGHGSKKEHPLNGLGVYTIDHHQPLLSITNHQPLQAIVTITTTI